MKYFRIYIILQFICMNLGGQTYPSFGTPVSVTINDWDKDVMEPFISPDGVALFFNTLNSGGNTNLYTTNRINDSIFTSPELVGGTYESTADHLDAVASLDVLGRFYWVSLRGYPDTMENLHVGKLSGGVVSGIKRVYGSFNQFDFNYPFGWIIMDAAINYQGDQLYYCNALFDFSNTTCRGVPCKASLGIATILNDTLFQKLSTSDQLLQNVNDTNYLVYAPQLSKNGLELYFTRMKLNGFNSEICVSVRNTLEEDFSKPFVIWSREGYMPEAATISADGNSLWFHQKNSHNLYQLYLMRRVGLNGFHEGYYSGEFRLYPNPARDQLVLQLKSEDQKFTLSLFSLTGKKVWTGMNTKNVDVSSLSAGSYVAEIKQGTKVYKTMIIIQ